MKILIAAVFMLFSVFVIFSSPAQKVILKYDAVKGELSVDAAHKVADAGKHYIMEITVYVNKDKAETLQFKSQTNKTDQLVTIKITAKKDDKISVTTVCNLGGSKSEAIVVQ